MVRRDRLEAYPTLHQGVFAVGAGTCSIDASFPLSKHGLSFRKPPTIAFQLGLVRRAAPFQGVWCEEAVPGLKTPASKPGRLAYKYAKRLRFAFRGRDMPL